MAIAHDRESEDTAYVYKEIFESKVYLQHGVKLYDDATVLDVGGHIGMFSLFALRSFARVNACVIEPMPRTYAALCQNLRANAPDPARVRALNCGAASREQSAEFSFYPAVPGHSTMYPRQKAEVHRLIEQQVVAAPWAHSKVLAVLCFLLFPWRRQLVHLAAQWFFRSKSVRCQLRPLSDLIEQERIDKIDLLKIDVEDAELDVLAGIRTEHWPRIQQVVVETCDFEGRRQAVQALLEARGFRCVVEREPVARELQGYIVFAVREAVSKPVARSSRAALRLVHEPSRAVAG
jgi:FkbM family methyltransferase